MISSFWVLNCTMHLNWAGGTLSNGDMNNTSLTFLPFISLTYDKEGSFSFASSYFSSLFTWIINSVIIDHNSYGFGIKGTFGYLFQLI